MFIPTWNTYRILIPRSLATSAACDISRTAPLNSAREGPGKTPARSASLSSASLKKVPLIVEPVRSEASKDALLSFISAREHESRRHDLKAVLSSCALSRTEYVKIVFSAIDCLSLAPSRKEPENFESVMLQDLKDAPSKCEKLKSEEEKVQSINIHPSKRQFVKTESLKLQLSKVWLPRRRESSVRLLKSIP